MNPTISTFQYEQHKHLSEATALFTKFLAAIRKAGAFQSFKKPLKKNVIGKIAPKTYSTKKNLGFVFAKYSSIFSRSAKKIIN